MSAPRITVPMLIKQSILKEDEIDLIYNILDRFNRRDIIVKDYFPDFIELIHLGYNKAEKIRKELNIKLKAKILSDLSFVKDPFDPKTALYTKDVRNQFIEYYYFDLKDSSFLDIPAEIRAEYFISNGFMKSLYDPNYHNYKLNNIKDIFINYNPDFSLLGTSFGSNYFKALVNIIRDKNPNFRFLSYDISDNDKDKYINNIGFKKNKFKNEFYIGKMASNYSTKFLSNSEVYIDYITYLMGNPILEKMGYFNFFNDNDQFTKDKNLEIVYSCIDEHLKKMLLLISNSLSNSRYNIPIDEMSISLSKLDDTLINIIKRVAKNNGIKCTGFYDDCIGTLNYYIYNSKLYKGINNLNTKINSIERNICVIDAGANWFNLKVYKYNNGRFITVQENDNQILSGRVVDLLIFIKLYTIILSDIPSFDIDKYKYRLLKIAEQIKINLSTKDSELIYAYNSLIDFDVLKDKYITRDWLNNEIDDFIKENLQTQNVYDIFNVDVNTIKYVLVGGGLSKMPYIQNLINEYFKGKDLSIIDYSMGGFIFPQVMACEGAMYQTLKNVFNCVNLV